MLASYIIESHLGHGLDELSERWLGLETITYESLCGKGAKQISFADVAIGQATEYAAQDADFALRLEAYLRAQMDAKQLEMYEKMELPVAQVLFEMERNGVQIDRAELARQSAELGAELMKLEQEPTPSQASRSTSIRPNSCKNPVRQNGHPHQRPEKNCQRRHFHQ